MWDDPYRLHRVTAALVACAIAALAVGALAWLSRQPAFAIREVVVTSPLVRVNAIRLEVALRSELKGTFFTVDLDEGRQALAALPWVRQVALRRQWPHRLEVVVEEHVPLARWNDAALVNTHGEVFSARYDGELPRLGGPEGKAPEVATRYRAWGEALSPLKLELKEVRMSARGGWHLQANGAAGALGIELGRDDPDGRLARFIAAFPRTVGALLGAGTRVEQVDLRYKNGFAARIPGFKERAVRKVA